MAQIYYKTYISHRALDQHEGSQVHSEMGV